MIHAEQDLRLKYIIDIAWEVLFERIISGRLHINKESSLQLHLSKIIFDLGNIYCILPDESFEIEMETAYNNKSIDIVCILGDKRAAIELKCFMKASNRAKDIDGYDALKDIERLQGYNDFSVKKFFCLTDNKYYPETEQKGLGKSVSIKNGTIYPPHVEIIPAWAKKWKVNRDNPIVFSKEISLNWVSCGKWHYLNIDI